MPVTVTRPTPEPTGGLQPGLGFFAVVTLAFDANHTQAGEICDLNAIFPTFVYGGVAIKDTVNDGGFGFSFVSGASTSSNLIQVYGMPAAATSGPLVLLSDGAVTSAVDGQTWLFLGR